MSAASGFRSPEPPPLRAPTCRSRAFCQLASTTTPLYVLTEARIQWLITDFGRRLGVHRQAGLAEEISRLKSARARQTVAHEVTLAYYELLRAESLFDIAD